MQLVSVKPGGGIRITVLVTCPVAAMWNIVVIQKITNYS